MGRFNECEGQVGDRQQPWVITRRWWQPAPCVKGHSWYRTAVSAVINQKKLNSPGGLLQQVTWCPSSFVFDCFCIASKNPQLCFFSAPLNQPPSYRFIVNAGNDYLILPTLKASVVFYSLCYEEGSPWIDLCLGESCTSFSCFVFFFYFISLFFFYVFVNCLTFSPPQSQNSRNNCWFNVPGGGFDDWFFLTDCIWQIQSWCQPIIHVSSLIDGSLSNKIKVWPHIYGFWQVYGNIPTKLPCWTYLL